MRKSLDRRLSVQWSKRIVIFIYCRWHNRIQRRYAIISVWRCAIEIYTSETRQQCPLSHSPSLSLSFLSDTFSNVKVFIWFTCVLAALAYMLRAPSSTNCRHHSWLRIHEQWMWWHEAVAGKNRENEQNKAKNASGKWGLEIQTEYVTNGNARCEILFGQRPCNLNRGNNAIDTLQLLWLKIGAIVLQYEQYVHRRVYCSFASYTRVCPFGHDARVCRALVTVLNVQERITTKASVQFSIFLERSLVQSKVCRQRPGRELTSLGENENEELWRFPVDEMLNREAKLKELRYL